MNAQRLSKWERWLDDVAADLFELWYDGTRWRQLHELAQDNPAIPNAYDFLGWVDVLYLQAAALGVRRQAEIRGDSISLARLLNEVAHDPAVLLNAPFHFAVCHGHESIAFTITPSAEDVARAAEEDLRHLRTAATSVVETVIRQSLTERASKRDAAHLTRRPSSGRRDSYAQCSSAIPLPSRARYSFRAPYPAMNGCGLLQCHGRPLSKYARITIGTITSTTSNRETRNPKSVVSRNQKGNVRKGRLLKHGVPIAASEWVARVFHRCRWRPPAYGTVRAHGNNRGVRTLAEMQRKVEME